MHEDLFRVLTHFDVSITFLYTFLTPSTILDSMNLTGLQRAFSMDLSPCIFLSTHSIPQTPESTQINLTSLNMQEVFICL